MYNPFFKASIISAIIFISSCAPVNNNSSQNISIKEPAIKNEQDLISQFTVKKEEFNKVNKKFFSENIKNEIEIILPEYENKEIIDYLINAFELAVYKKKLDNVSLNINRYKDLSDLEHIINKKAIPGKIFIGALGSDSTKLVKTYCKKGILFFSFSADKNLAEDCAYLINFFPEDDLRALFNFFPNESKIALLYPENYYGKNINNIIDSIAVDSRSILINRSSYKEDLTNAHDSIKELSKYDVRRAELERQKKILEKREDNISKKALKKIKKFETIGNVDFTHLILPDYSIRLLEIASLLPFYDVDPNKVQFVGTGVWDDKAFFDEPALQGAIFSGISEENRRDFFDDYKYIYKELPIRTATIPYDLMGIISYILEKKMNLEDVYNLLDNGNVSFEGIDGQFYFINNTIQRELKILVIKDGKAKKLN